MGPLGEAISRRIEPGDCDELGHLGFLTYQRLADDLVLQFWDRLQSESGIALGERVDFVTLELNVRYRREVRAGDTVDICCGLFDSSARKLLFWAEISRDGDLCCLIETLVIAFSPVTRRSVVLSDALNIAAINCRMRPPSGSTSRLTLS